MAWEMNKVKDTHSISFSAISRTLFSSILVNLEINIKSSESSTFLIYMPSGINIFDLCNSSTSNLY